MLPFIAQRFLAMIPVWLLLSVMSFSLIHLSPANPALLLLGGPEVPHSDVVRLTHQLGLDQPLPVQYVLWMKSMLRGDWGYSYFLHESVLPLLFQRATVTVGIAALGLIIALVIGITTGIISAARPGSIVDIAMAGLSTLGLSIPEFWLAIILILLFAVHFPLFPVAGFVSFSSSPTDWFLHIFLPGFTIGFVQSAVISRIVRSSVLDTLRQPYIQTARAKGVGRTAILFKHALRSSLLPVLTVLGIVVVLLLAGDFIIEVVFTIPGLGQTLITATLDHDYPLVQGGILFVGTAIMLINLMVDLSYALVDPRVRYG
ncbi:MAG: ABC transporter permease [Chloroflexota bacterium]|nr:ABC transporter permease [Chloroflexota bacterium]